MHYWSSAHDPGSTRRWIRESPKLRQYHFSSRRHSSEFPDYGRGQVFPLHASTLPCGFISQQPCFVACDNSLHKSLYQNCMQVSTRDRLCSSINCFGTYPAQILWYPWSSWTMEYAYPQLMSSLPIVSVTNPSILLNQSINSFSIVRRSLYGRTARAVVINDTCSVTLEIFHPLILLPWRNPVFSVLC